MPSVSGKQLCQWREQAIAGAIAADVSPLEVDWLLAEAGLDRLSWRLSFERSHFLNHSLGELTELWQRRLRERIPIQYLAGATPWRHFSLKVSPDVLIPRPETEYLIDLVQMAIAESPDQNIASGHWVDLGTGSGAIALGLAEALPQATIHAVDCSQAALQIAQDNAACLGLTQRVKFYLGSWWSPLATLKGQSSAMVSNPPYIPTDLMAQLSPEVAHEPRSALDGGADGLNHIRHLVESAPAYLKPGGIWLIEMMAGQSQTVSQMLHQQGSYRNIQIFRDLAGIDRYALAYRC